MMKMHVKYYKGYCNVDVTRTYGMFFTVTTTDCEDIKSFKYEPDTYFSLEEGDNVQSYEHTKDRIEDLVKVSRRNNGYSNTITFFIPTDNQKYEKLESLVVSIPSFLDNLKKVLAEKHLDFQEYEKVLSKFNDKTLETITLEI